MAKLRAGMNPAPTVLFLNAQLALQPLELVIDGIVLLALRPVGAAFEGGVFVPTAGRS